MGDGDLLCLIPGPTKVVREVDAGVRWCFGCRARLPHTDRLLDYDYDPADPTTYPYYDPAWVRVCARCGQDRTTFPGRGGW